MSIIFGPGVGKPPVNTPPDTLPDSTPNDKLPVVVQLVPGQVGNMLEFRDTAGAVLSFVDNTGDFSGLAPTGAVTLTPSTSARNVVQSTVGTATPLTVKAQAGQSVRLLEWQDSGGGLLGGVGPGGSCIFKGFAVGTNAKSANYTAVGTDHYIPVDATAGAVTITLPAASVATPFGFQLQVAKVDATANTVTVQRAGADTFVGGGTSVVLSAQSDTTFVQSDGVSVWEAFGPVSLSPAVILAPGTVGRNTITPTSDAVEGLVILAHSNTATGALLQTEHFGGDIALSVFPQGGGTVVTCGNSNVAGDWALQVIGSTGGTSPVVVASDFNGGNLFRVEGGGVLTLWKSDALGVSDNVADLTPAFLDNTHASWKGRVVLNAHDSAGTREVMRGEGDGSAARIGFFGATAVVKQTGASAAGIAAITDANAKAAVSALQTALANLGLVTSPA